RSGGTSCAATWSGVAEPRRGPGYAPSTTRRTRSASQLPPDITTAAVDPGERPVSASRPARVERAGGLGHLVGGPPQEAHGSGGPVLADADEAGGAGHHRRDRL